MRGKLLAVLRAVGLYLITNKKARALELALALAVWEEAIKPVLSAAF